MKQKITSDRCWLIVVSAVFAVTAFVLFCINRGWIAEKWDKLLVIVWLAAAGSAITDKLVPPGTPPLPVMFKISVTLIAIVVLVYSSIWRYA